MPLVERARRWVVDTRGLPLVFVALTIIALVPVWHQRMLPMLEMPKELALARDWHAVHAAPPLLFYATIRLLLHVAPIEVANKLFLSAYLILFPLSLSTLARALGRSPWLALAAFPLAFNQCWIYGFSSYLLATCFFFLSLAWLIRWLDGGPRWLVAALCGSVLLAYFGHMLPWLCFVLCAIALLVVRWRDWKRSAWAALAMLPSLLLAARAFDRDAWRGPLRATWHDFPTLVAEFPRRVMELFPGNADRWVLATIALTIVVIAAWSGTRRADDTPAQRRQLGAILVVLGVAYTMLPYRVDQPVSWWYVSPRVPAMMAPLIALLPVERFAGWRKLLMAPVIVCAIVLPLTLARLYAGFQRRNGAFMRMLDQTPRDSRVLVVVRELVRAPGTEELSDDPSTSAPVYWNFASWPAALHGGSDVEPVVNGGFTARSAPDFDYYVVRGGQGDSMDREPSLKVLERQDAWTLYQRIHKMTDEP